MWPTSQRRRQAGSVGPVRGGKRPAARARSAGAVCEALEGRVLLSKARVVDAGEYYWDYSTFAQKTQISLLRTTDQIVVGFVPSSTQRMRRLSAAITSRTGPLAGYEVVGRITGYSALLRRTARGFSPLLETLQQGAARFPGFKYLGPTYFQSVDSTRIAPLDSVFVDLRDDMNPATFFGRGWSGFEPALGTNAYYGTLARSGGADAVRVAARLDDNPVVDRAVPNFAGTITPFLNLTDYSSTNQWNLAKTSFPQSWDSKTGDGDEG